MGLDSLSHFIYRSRVYYGDTDAFQVAYYGRYLYWLEAARLEWFFDMHFSCNQLLADQRICFVVASVKMDYQAPLRVEDAFTIHLFLRQIRRVSLEVDHQFVREGQVVNQGVVTLVTIDADTFKPVSVPASFLAAYDAWRLIRG